MILGLVARGCLGVSLSGVCTGSVIVPGMYRVCDGGGSRCCYEWLGPVGYISRNRSGMVISMFKGKSDNGSRLYARFKS